MGRQEAFEIFRSEREENITIEDNKIILKQRSVSLYGVTGLKVKGQLHGTACRINN